MKKIRVWDVMVLNIKHKKGFIATSLYELYSDPYISIGCPTSSFDVLGVKAREATNLYFWKLILIIFFYLFIF